MFRTMRAATNMGLFVLLALFVATSETYAMEVRGPPAEGATGSLLSAWFAPVVPDDKDVSLGEAESAALTDAETRQFFVATRLLKKGAELRQGMLITMQNDEKYCHGGTNTCHATAVGVFRVVSGGDGYIALRNGKEEYKGTHHRSPLASLILSLEALLSS